MSNVKTLPKHTGYYTSKFQAITDLGYNDPNTDTDERQVRIARILRQENFDLDIKIGYDCADLGHRESEYYEFFQTRAPGEQELEQMYEDFYILEKRKKRIPMGMYVEGELFIFSGNRRMRTHEYALTKIDEKTGEQMHESRCDVLVIDKPDLSTNDKLNLAHRLARLANKQEDSVRDEKPSEDYPYQLLTAYRLHCQKYPEASKWSSEQKDDWGKKWIIKNISEDYDHESRSSVLSSIVNSAFGMNGRGVSLPMPDDDTIRAKWKEFFGRSATWNLTSQKVTMLKLPSRPDFIRQTLYNEWKQRLTPSAQRKSCYLVIRAGNRLNSEISSLKTVEMARKTALKAIADYNKNPNHGFAGFHIIRRVMLVKQMNLDDYVAYEWDEDTEEFYQKEKPSNG